MIDNVEFAGFAAFRPASGGREELERRKGTTDLTPNEVRERLTERGWLSEWDAAFQSRVLEAGRILTLKRGETLYHLGDEPGGTYGIASGAMLFSVSGADQLPAAGHIMRQGGWFGWGSYAIRRARTVSAGAIEPTRLFHLPIANLRIIFREDPEAARRFYLMRDRGEEQLLAVISDLLIRDTSRRVAAVLLRVSGALDGIAPEDPRGVLLTRSLLGELANTSRDSVTRIVSDFTGRGWISGKYGRVRILDPVALQAFVAGTRTASSGETDALHRPSENRGHASAGSETTATEGRLSI